MNCKELLKILEYIQEYYNLEDFYITGNDGWDWNIQHFENLIDFVWDRDKTSTFEEFKKEYNFE